MNINDPPLYGDYAQIIDAAFKKLTPTQIENIKKSVAEADRLDRAGLAKLKYYLNKHGKNLTDKSTYNYILVSCEIDQEAYDRLQARTFTPNIDQLPSGAYRVRVTVEHNQYRQIFKTKTEAVTYRDRMLELQERLKQD